MRTKVKGVVAGALLVGGAVAITMNPADAGAKSPGYPSADAAVAFYRATYGPQTEMGTSPNDSLVCELKQQAGTAANRPSNPPYPAPTGYTWKWKSPGVFIKTEQGRPTDFWSINWSLCNTATPPSTTT